MDSFQVLPLGLSKYVGVSKLLEALGLGPENLMACGDGENDIQMLKVAHLLLVTNSSGFLSTSLLDSSFIHPYGLPWEEQLQNLPNGNNTSKGNHVNLSPQAGLAMLKGKSTGSIDFFSCIIVVLHYRLQILLPKLAICKQAPSLASWVQAAAIGVHVANAVQLAREAADFGTTSNDEAGVALAIEEHILKPRGLSLESPI